MKNSLKVLQKDPIIKKLIERYGELETRTGEVDLFSDLTDSITSQQLSVKAASTIFGRLKTLVSHEPPFKPQEILKLSPEKMRECGLSYSKINYIKNLAEAVINKTIDLEKVKEMSDEDARAALIALKGIGPWTAEMILMFSLERPDIFSIGDMGLRNAISKLYGVDKEDLQKIEKISDQWKPYRTLACRYLWKSLDNEPL